MSTIKNAWKKMILFLTIQTTAVISGTFTLQHCNKSVCLFSPGTAESSWATLAEAQSGCLNQNLKLLEVYDSRYQEVLTEALKTWSWIDYRSTEGYCFRMNMYTEGQKKWSWIDGAEAAEPPNQIDGSSYASISFTKSGVTYSDNRKEKGYICSLPSPCMDVKDYKFATSDSCVVMNSGAALSWHDARTRCLDLGGDLVSKTGLVNWPKDIIYGDYWIGLSKIKFYWSSTNQQVIYTYWEQKQPDEKLDCAHVTMNGNGKVYWRMESCAGKKPYICMSSLPEEIISKTSTTISNNPNNESNVSNQKMNIAFAIGGCLVLTIIVILVIVILRHFRNLRQKVLKEKLIRVMRLPDSCVNADEGTNNPGYFSEGIYEDTLCDLEDISIIYLKPNARQTINNYSWHNGIYAENLNVCTRMSNIEQNKELNNISLKEPSYRWESINLNIDSIPTISSTVDHTYTHLSSIFYEKHLYAGLKIPKKGKSMR